METDIVVGGHRELEIAHRVCGENYNVAFQYAHPGQIGYHWVAMGVLTLDPGVSAPNCALCHMLVTGNPGRVTV